MWVPYDAPTPYYNPNGRSPAGREKFLEWHKELKDNDYVFNFQEEILAYCRSDVDILQRCCLEFRELFRDVTEIDPFEKCLTILSACNQVLSSRKHHCHPPRGYYPENKQSLLAQKWLSYTTQINDCEFCSSYYDCAQGKSCCGFSGTCRLSCIGEFDPFTMTAHRVNLVVVLIESF